MDQLHTDYINYMKFLKEPSCNTNLDSDPACWLTQLFSGDVPEDSVVNTLLNILRNTGINCSIDESSGTVQSSIDESSGTVQCS